MTDLVTRLRKWETVFYEETDGPNGALYIKAADEVERLQAALEAADKMADMFESLLYDEPAREPGIYDIDALDAYKAIRAMKGKP